MKTNRLREPIKKKGKGKRGRGGTGREECTCTLHHGREKKGKGEKMDGRSLFDNIFAIRKLEYERNEEWGKP